MSLVYLLNGIDGNSLVQGVFSKENDELLKFGIGGKYLGSSPFAYRHSKIREIDMVSLINVDNNWEIGYIISNKFKKFSINPDIFNVIQWCNSHPALVFIGNREMTYSDTKGDVDYNQYFFGFTKGNLNENQLQAVMRVDG